MSRPETSDGLENITVDPSGGLLVSDPLTLARRNLDAQSFAELILKEDRPLSAVLPPSEATASEREWSAHGWARSLDYFLWSEGGRDARRTLISPRNRSLFPGGNGAIVQALLARRTQRYFDTRPLPLDVWGQLVAAVKESLNGLGTGSGCFARAIVYDVESFAAGVYDLTAMPQGPIASSDPHALREVMIEIMTGMTSARTAAATIVLCLDLETRQSSMPYERALREAYIEVGMIGQFLVIAGESLGVGSLVTPAISDQKLHELLGLERRNVPLYSITMGLRPLSS